MKCHWNILGGLHLRRMLEVVWSVCDIVCVCSQCWNNVGRSNENESDSCPAGSLLVKAHFFLGMCDIVPYPCWVQQSDVYMFSYSAFFPSTTFPPYNIKKYSIRNQAKGHAATKFEWYPPYQVILYEICAICLIRTMLPLNFWGHWIVWPLGQTQRDVAGRSCWVNSPPAEVAGGPAPEEPRRWKLEGMMNWVCICDHMYTYNYIYRHPPKFNMEPETDGLKKRSLLFQGKIFRFHGKLQGCICFAIESLLYIYIIIYFSFFRYDYTACRDMFIMLFFFDDWQI